MSQLCRRSTTPQPQVLMILGKVRFLCAPPPPSYMRPNSFDCTLLLPGNELSMELGMELLEESIACFVFVSQVEKECNW